MRQKIGKGIQIWMLITFMGIVCNLNTQDVWATEIIDGNPSDAGMNQDQQTQQDPSSISGDTTMQTPQESVPVYRVHDGYLYEVNPADQTENIRIKDPTLEGGYRKIVDGVCYKISYKTGEAVQYTGIFESVCYKNGYVQKQNIPFYTVYRGYCYKVNLDGIAQVYIKNQSKSGCFRKVIDQVCYKVEYQTGKVHKYTGIYNKKYYVKGTIYTGWSRKAKVRRYYKKGVAATGWCTIGKEQYYFNSQGKLLTNQIVGSRYVDDKGIYVNDKTMKLAVAFVNKHSNIRRSNAVRLKECYDYLWKNIAYKRTYGIPGRADMDDIAYSMLYNKYGNCFCFGSTFAYIAKALGYEVRTAVGEISARRGGMTPHGWCEVRVNGQWLICDPDMQMNFPQINVYMQTQSQYRYKHNVNHHYYLKIAKGKVTWK